MRDKQILDFMILRGINREWSTKDIAKGTGVSSNTARKWLERLCKQGKVISHTKYYGRGRSMLVWWVNKTR